MEKKNILLLSDSFHGYGAEYMLIWVGKILLEEGYEIVYCSIKDEDIDYRIAQKSKYISLGVSSNQRNVGKIYSYFVTGSKQLCKVCKENNIDCIITFKENPFCLALIAKFFCGVKIIHSERDDPYNRDTFASRIKMFLFRFCDYFVFQTEGAREFYCNTIKTKSAIIPNPVEIPKEHWCLEKCSKTVVNVGRLNIRYKRQDILIESFAKFLESHNDWNLVFLGDGKDMSKLESKAKELQIEDHIEFKGKVSNVKDYLLQSGIFVLSSDTEGMPNALMEAMSLGMPVITTDCSPGGGRYLVQNMNNGILVQRGNTNKLYQAIVHMSSFDKSVIQMGLNARRDMAKHNPSFISKLWLQIINNI